MKMGIEDYILKPFKPDELKAKIAKALKMSSTAPPAATRWSRRWRRSFRRPPAADAKAAAAGGKQFVDILCIDDMENVAKRLRTMIPEHVTLNTATSAAAALAICRERVFRIIMVDNDIPDVDSSSLMRQLRVMQPQAAFVALSLRSVAKAQDEAREAGFVGVHLQAVRSGGARGVPAALLRQPGADRDHRATSSRSPPSRGARTACPATSCR